MGLVLLLGVSLPADAGESIGWQEAVARFAAERSSAETCVIFLRRYAADDKARLEHGESAYREARAKVNGVISSLIVGLAQDGPKGSLDDLKAGLSEGVTARVAFCEGVKEIVPQDPGARDPVTLAAIIGAGGAVVAAAVVALIELYKQSKSDDQLLIRTIQTQLEATKWDEFGDIKASS